MEDINASKPAKKSTGLQKRLESLFESHKEGFKENISLLRDMTNIAQNRGYSHMKRVGKINNIMSSASNFNQEERDYVNKLLRMEKKYIEHKQAIKNKEEVYKEIYNLRKGILENLIEKQEHEIEAASHPTAIILPNYDWKEEPIAFDPSQKVLNPPGNAIHHTTPITRHFYKKAGGVLAAGVIALTAAAILGLSSFFMGSYSQKPAIEKKNTQITTQEKEMEELRSSIEETKRSVYDLNNALLSRYNEQKAETDALKEQVSGIKQSYSAELSNIEGCMTKLEGEIATNTSVLEEIQKEEQATNQELANIQKKMPRDLEGGRIDQNIKALEQKIDELSSQIGKIEHPEAKIEIRVGKEGPRTEGTKYLDEPQIYSERRYDERPIPIIPHAETASALQKQHYLKDKPFDYPRELDYKSDRQWKEKKHAASILTRLGWFGAIVNDIVEIPVNLVGRPVGAVAGAGVGAVAEVFTPGYTNEIAKASKSGFNFPPYLMDGLPGGRSSNAFHGRLLQLKPKEAFEVGYESETTELGAIFKDGIIIGSDIIPFLLGNNGNGSSSSSAPDCPALPHHPHHMPSEGFWVE